jgi:signal transduction histidine kinase
MNYPMLWWMIVPPARISLSAPSGRPQHVNMKQRLIQLAQRYRVALRTHLQAGARDGRQPALVLGRQAVGLGLETLDLARIHEQALETLDLSQSKNGHVKRARLFFTEAITPIIETHRAARENRSALNRLNEMLGRCTADLGVSNRRLKQSIVRRQTVEADLKKTGENYRRLLKDSIQLQEGFRQLTRQVMAAQETERKHISGELQNEIVQTLVGVHVRLLSLKQQSKRNTLGLKNEIASTKRLVAKSVKSVRVVATRLGSS